MRALLLSEPLAIAPTERDEPTAKLGEALVKVHSIGICGSDLHAFRGHHPFVSYPRVLGHELGVEVLEIRPNEQGIVVGDKVCIEPILACGTCFPCRQQRYNCCTAIKVLGIHTDGGMAERIAVPINRLHKPTVDLTYDELALCETLSIGVQAVKRANVQAGESVLIMGGGPIGLGCLVAALDKGARVLVSDPIAKNREAAMSMGADAVVDPVAEDLATRTREWAGPDGGAHVVLEAVGVPATIAATIDCAAPTGRVVIIGVCKEQVPIKISDLMRKEVALLTTRNSCGAFPAVLKLFENHRAALAKMVTHQFGFDEGTRVFNWLHEARGGAGVIKAVLQF